jgi:peptide/nickel transport system permease protein
MRGVLARRLRRLVLTLFVVSCLSALMLSLLPGDPALQVASADYNITRDQLDDVRRELGLDRPIPVRYAQWVGDAAQGDLGRSFRTRQPVTDAIVDRLPVTLELMVAAQIMALLFALLVAPLSAYTRGSLFDRGSTTVSFALLSLPNFILGLLLIYLFAVKLQLLPATGFEPLSAGLGPNLKSILLPAATLAAAEAAIYARLLRAEMITTLQEDFVLVAHSKGLPRWRIVLQHALRPSSLPLVTIAGLNIGHLIGGSVIVETLFALPGVGRLAVDSILARDFVMVQGIVAFVTIAYVVVNFVVDLLYYALDPRIRHATA